MNKVYLIGNLTRDPELRETASGVPVCGFTLAVTRPYSNSQGGERQTDFFNCTAWRNQAETIARYVKKGQKFAVCGSVQLRDYEDNQGAKRTTVDIIVQDFEFLAPKGEEGFDESAPAPARKKGPVLQAMDDDTDIPF